MSEEKMMETPSDENVALTDEEKQFVSFADTMDSEDDEEPTLEETEAEGEEKEEAEPVEVKADEAESAKGDEEPAVPTEAVKAEPEPEPEPEKPATEKQPEPVQQQPQATEPEATTQEELKAQREQLEEALARDIYAMSEEDSDTMLLDPRKVLPKLAARVHAEVLSATVNGILAHIPRLVQGELQRTQTQGETRQAFYQKWPKLVGHEATVGKIAQLYAQINPTVDEAQMIADVGLQAMLSLQLPLEEGNAVPPAPPSRPATTSRPANPGGAVGMVPQPRPSSNPFVEMAEEFINDD